MTLLAWSLAGVIGLSLGLLGGGGSILTVPIFTYILGYGAKQAIAMSLPVVGLAAAVGAASGLRRGILPVVPASLVGAATMAGSFTGARLATRLEGSTQLAMLAVAMLSAAVAMWLRSRRTAGYAAASHRHPLVLGAIGLGVGLLTGVVGIGGGFMIVPALVIAGGLPMREAQSASLYIIALSAAAGLAGYFGRVELIWPVIFSFAAVAALGVLAGGALARRMSQQLLQQVFAVFLVVLACYMLVRG